MARRGSARVTRLWRRAVGVGSWVVFVIAWWRVFELNAMVSAQVLVALGACAVAVLLVDLWWVGHNRRIYRRKGPRKGRPFLSGRLTRDWLGRPLHVAPEARRSAVVTISVTENGTKMYRAGAL